MIYKLTTKDSSSISWELTRCLLSEMSRFVVVNRGWYDQLPEAGQPGAASLSPSNWSYLLWWIVTGLGRNAVRRIGGQQQVPLVTRYLWQFKNSENFRYDFCNSSISKILPGIKPRSPRDGDVMIYELPPKDFSWFLETWIFWILGKIYNIGVKKLRRLPPGMIPSTAWCRTTRSWFSRPKHLIVSSLVDCD